MKNVNSMWRCPEVGGTEDFSLNPSMGHLGARILTECYQLRDDV